MHEARDITLHHSLGATVIQFSALVFKLLEGVFDIILKSIGVTLIFSLRRQDTASFSRAFIHDLRSIKLLIGRLSCGLANLMSLFLFGGA